MGLSQVQIGHALTKAHLAAECNDLSTQVFYHLHQFKGTDVGMGLHQNIGRRAGVNQFVHDLAAQIARVFDLAPQLAV